MRRAAMLLVVACIAGCPGTDSAAVDAPNDPDGSTGTARLTVRWSTSPEVPANIGADRTLGEVRLRMENFEMLGDGNPSSAPSFEEYKLRWNGDSSPEPVVFEDVPMGLYTSIVFQLREGDGEDAFDIRGTVDTNEQHDFEIKDTDTLSITIAGFNLNLVAGQDVTIEVGVNLGPSIAEIDFASMNLNDGDYIIEKGVNPQIGTFRTRLSNAFSVTTVAPN